MHPLDFVIALAEKLLSVFMHVQLRIKLLRRHPVDVYYGTETGGYKAPKHLTEDKILAGQINPYAAVQPSIVRQALKALPPVYEDYSFVDIGCGKGRATVVASEFLFRRIIGVEISSQLAGIARNNATIIGRKYPLRTKIEILEGNAVDFHLPSPTCVLFLYNSFGAEMMKAFLNNLEQDMQQGEHVFIVYHNPTCENLLDEAAFLTRWFAGQLRCDDAERGYGYKSEGMTGIWQSRKNELPPRHLNADTPLYGRP